MARGIVLVLATFGAAFGALSLVACGSGLDKELASRLTKSKYQVSATGSNLTFSPAGTQSVTEDETITFTVTANSGYQHSTTVGGTCPAGSWTGSAYTTGAIKADCSVGFSANPSFQVTASGAHLSFAPSAVQTIVSGSYANISVTADSSYTALTAVTGTCPTGVWSGSTYRTGAVTADCNVQFSAVTGSTYSVGVAVTNISISPAGNQIVAAGSSPAFTLTAPTGYTRSNTVGGTCPAGSWAANVYTLGAVNSNCTVSFSATQDVYTVSSSMSGGTVSPATNQSRTYGQTVQYTVTKDHGYKLSSTVGGTCPAGSWSGNVYTTGAIVGSCSVSFSATGASLIVDATGGDGEVYFLKRETSGTTVFSGDTTGSLPSNTRVGSRDLYVAKVDSSKNIVWAHQLGSVGNPSYATGGASDVAGNVYAVGRTYGSFDGVALTGYSDAVVIKYDTAGTKKWVRLLGTNTPAAAAVEGEAVGVDGAGNVFVAGHTDRGLNGNTKVGGVDMFLAKYDEDGTLLWVKQRGVPSKFVEPEGLTLDSSGNIYVTGKTQGSISTKGQAQTGTWDFFVAKIDPAGTLVWADQRGPASTLATGVEIAIDSSGNVIATGYTYGGLNGNTQTGSSDYFVVKYNNSGDLQWLRQQGNAASESVMSYAVKTDVSGNIYLAGTVNNVALPGAVQGGQIDGFLAKYSGAGTVISMSQMGNTGRIYCRSLDVNSSGYVMTGGSTNGSLGGYSASGYDLFLTWDIF